MANFHKLIRSFLKGDDAVGGRDDRVRMSDQTKVTVISVLWVSSVSMAMICV